RRVYEAVVLKVLGATRSDVTRAFLIEYGILGLTTAAIAACLGTLAAYLVLTRVMHQEWSFMPAVVVSTALIATALTLGIGYAGTWRALGAKAAPFLRIECGSPCLSLSSCSASSCSPPRPGRRRRSPCRRIRPRNGSRPRNTRETRWRT
ncbi:MAG TPA: FtsX-like permease family protein, partial [Stellaceae bacterium]